MSFYLAQCSPGAITSSPFGKGAITLGQIATDKAGILFDTVANNTLVNDVIFKTALGNDTPGVRFDTIGNVFSGQITADGVDATFSTGATNTGAVSLTGKITGTGGLALTPPSNAGTSNLTVTLNNAGTASDYLGATTIGKVSTSNYTLQLGASDQIPNASAVNVSGGTLNIAGFSDTVGAVTMTSGAINGSGGVLTGTSYALQAGSVSAILGGSSVALTKTTAGTVTLSGANTYTGATLVNAGTLTLASTGSIANSSGIQVGNSATYNVAAVSGYTVGSTQTLSGGGNVTGATIIAGTHAPGVAGVGSQNFSSTLNYDSGSIFEWNLNAVSAVDPGAASSNGATGTYDQVSSSGAMTGGAAIFKVVLSGNVYSDAFWTTSKSWTNVFSGAGAADNLGSVFSGFSGTGVNSDGTVPDGMTRFGQFTFNGSGSTLNWTPVPEPSSALAGLLLGAGLLRRRRSA